MVCHPLPCVNKMLSSSSEMFVGSRRHPECGKCGARELVHVSENYFSHEVRSVRECMGTVNFDESRLPEEFDPVWLRDDCPGNATSRVDRDSAGCR